MARILIADDDPIVAEIFGEAFRGAGHEVRAVTDGREVIAALGEFPTDCLILDCMMPLVTGIEVLRLLRSSQKYCRLPVIMLTARTSPSDREVALNSRVDLYCTKHCDPDWLVFQAEDQILRKAMIAPPAIDPWLDSLGPRRFV